VSAVAPGSPAADAGLAKGDVITEVNGARVGSARDANRAIQRAAKQDSVTLTVEREGWQKTVEVGPAVVQAPPTGGWVGLSVDALPPGREPGKGALVLAVSPGGPGETAGLRPGDVITHADSAPLDEVSTLVAKIKGWPVGQPLRLRIFREGWAKDVSIVPATRPAGEVAQTESYLPAPVQPAPATRSAPVLPPAAVVVPPSAYAGGSAPGTYAAAPPSGYGGGPTYGSGPAYSGRAGKATVAVGDFQVKAATASQAIGDGLREMLVTALHNSGDFIVVERMDIPGLAAEQALSRSRMARPGAAIPEAQMDVADVMVYGAVTEFEAEEGGSGLTLGVPKLPFSFGRQTKTAHMAIDVRLVDVTTGRILASNRIAGQAEASQTSLGIAPTVSGSQMPVSLGTFANTPMEQTIRDCIEKAVVYVRGSVPAQYYRHP
jgi:curli biogenesis system outer membrane secretion channel CsgG